MFKVRQAPRVTELAAVDFDRLSVSAETAASFKLRTLIELKRLNVSSRPYCRSESVDPRVMAISFTTEERGLRYRQEGRDEPLMLDDGGDWVTVPGRAAAKTLPSLSELYGPVGTRYRRVLKVVLRHEGEREFSDLHKGVAEAMAKEKLDFARHRVTDTRTSATILSFVYPTQDWHGSSLRIVADDLD